MKFKYTKLPPTVQYNGIVYYLTKQKSFFFNKDKKKDTIYHIRYENDSKKEQVLVPVVKTYDNKIDMLMASSDTEKKAYDNLLKILNNSSKIIYKRLKDYYNDSIENINKKLREE